MRREAFRNQHSPRCDEHYLVYIICRSKNVVPGLDIVAVYNEKVMGNVAYMKAVVKGDAGNKFENNGEFIRYETKKWAYLPRGINLSHFQRKMQAHYSEAAWKGLFVSGESRNRLEDAASALGETSKFPDIVDRELDGGLSVQHWKEYISIRNCAFQNVFLQLRPGSRAPRLSDTQQQ